MTIAAQNAPEAQSRVLAGHVFAGADENYIVRNPRFVAEAAEAIERHYFA